MTDLESRIEEVLKEQMSEHGVEPHWCKDAHCEATRQTTLFFMEATQNLKQLFIEWAEGLIPQERSWDKKDADSLEANQARAFNSCRTQTINNLKRNK